MKKLLVLLALCMILTVALVACETDPGTTDESTAGTTEAPTTDAPTTEEPTTEPGTTDTTEPGTTDTTEPGTTDTTDTTDTTTPPPPPVDPVKVSQSLDEIDTWISGTKAAAFFTPGQSASWTDKAATIEDYNVDTIRVWGWAGFFAETPGTFGYQIDDNDPVFDAAFSVEAGADVVAAAGGKSASRFQIYVPVLYLNGEHTIKALVKDAVGTVEEIVVFTITKTANPNAPAAFVPAADMASSIPGSPGINGCTLSADGTYVTIDTIGQGDPYYQLPMLNAKGTVGAFVAIKYRSTSTHTKSEMFVGSGAGPSGQGDNIQFDLVCDDKWNLAIIDLSQVSAVADGVINYLRWDPFAGAADATIDLAYIAVFGNYEAAFAYDAQFADIYRDVPAHSDLAVNLGVRTDGGPFVGGEKKFGQKLPLGETFLKNVTVSAMATYADGNENTWSFKVWQWAGDYATTVAGTPLFVTTGENHNDNSDFTVEIPAKLLISGDVYYEIEYLTGAKNFTPWTAESVLVEGVESYVDGNLKEGTYASSVVVGVELPPVETIPYDGENGTTTVPVQGVKYFVRNASGMTLVIENAFNFVVTIDNLNGETKVLQADMLGKIELEIPFEWMSFELTIDNVCGEPAEFSMTFVAPVEPGAGDGTPDAPYVMSGTEGTISAEIITGWDSVFYTFTAEADGVLNFVGPDNMSIFIEDAYGSEWLFDGNGTYAVTAGTTYKFFVADANWTAGTIEGTWSFSTGAATPEASEATISFADLTYRTEDGGEEYQVFSNNGFVYTQNQGTNTNGVKVDQYNNPIRLYKDHVATFEFAGMTKLVVVFDTSSKTFAGFTDAIDALADANVTYSAEGDVVTVVFATPVDSFNLVLANQVRVLSMTAISE